MPGANRQAFQKIKGWTIRGCPLSRQACCSPKASEKSLQIKWLESIRIKSIQLKRNSPLIPDMALIPQYREAKPLIPDTSLPSFPTLLCRHSRHFSPVIPDTSLLSFPPPLSRHSHRLSPVIPTASLLSFPPPLSCHSRRLSPVIPAAPLLSFPTFVIGNPSGIS